VQTVGGTVQAAGNTVVTGVRAMAGVVESAAENAAQVAQAALGRGESVHISRLQDIVGQGLVLIPSFRRLLIPPQVANDARAGRGSAAAITTGVPVRNEDGNNGIAEREVDDMVELQRIIQDGDLGNTVHASSSTSHPRDSLTTSDWVVCNGGLGNTVLVLPLSHLGEIDDNGNDLAGPSGTNGSRDAGGDEEDPDGFERIHMSDCEVYVRSIGSPQDDLSFQTAPLPEDRDADLSRQEG